MNILIIGGGGMIGRKLAERLARDGTLGGEAISGLTLYDLVEAALPAGAKVPVRILTGDLPAPGEAARLVADRPDTIFHLAAIVSGEAEQDFLAEVLPVLGEPGGGAHQWEIVDPLPRPQCAEAFGFGVIGV